MVVRRAEHGAGRAALRHDRDERPGLHERAPRRERERGLFETLENTLDVTHTAYVHRGLIRGGRAPIEITAIVSRTASGVEAEYVGETNPPGLAVRILAPAGGIVRHIDRFLLPCIAQVDYWLGEANHFRVTSFCTPVDRENTTIFATISLRLRSRLGWFCRS